MTRRALIVKAEKERKKYLKNKTKRDRLKKIGDSRYKTLKVGNRVKRRCSICNDDGGFRRFFGACGNCVRQLCRNADFSGVTKSSW